MSIARHHADEQFTVAEHGERLQPDFVTVEPSDPAHATRTPRHISCSRSCRRGRERSGNRWNRVGRNLTYEEKDPLSIILEELNQIFGEKVNGDTPGAIQHLQGKLAADIALQKGTEANPPETFRLLFDQVVDERFAEMVDNFFEFYQRVTNDPRAKERLFDWLFEEYRRRKGEDS